MIPHLAGPPPATPEADRVVEFVRALTHSKGEWAGHKFRLRPWQERLLRELFGRINPDGTRQYRQAYIEIPRKNGKTELAAAIALYGLLMDKEPGAEVYGAAVDRDQASLVFHAAAAMVRNDPGLARQVQVVPSTRRIVRFKTGSFYRAIPGDAPSAHGYNAHMVIYDEFHAARDGRLWDVLRTSTGARRQPLLVVITTAGHDRLSVCWEMHRYAEQVRDGTITDPTFLPVLYGAPEAADWEAEATWFAANPALGDFRSLDEMRTAYQQAKHVPARQNAFRQLYLCQWTESHSRWLDLAKWRACPTDTPSSELALAPCYGGLDLGETDDLSAFVQLWVLPDGRYVCRPHFWCSEGTLEKYQSRPYALWQSTAQLTVTPGDVCDFGVVERDVLALARASGLRRLAFDKRFAAQLAQNLQGAGLEMIDTAQGFGLNEALRSLSDLVVAGRLDHGGHPILTWMAGNAVVRRGEENKIRLDKRTAGEKIDGISALTMALSLVVGQPDPAALNRALEARGVLVLG